ncbi:hypothetical protein GCK32_012758 [Trichostrongylus colubriformis]|uniref:Alpha/beta hydrolase fold-3 domain-containing protein n=1 Tax=Trichostrongylus colubriformis TaxID=6319 RepID=A0AAN8IRE9_TRICO
MNPSLGESAWVMQHTLADLDEIISMEENINDMVYQKTNDRLPPSSKENDEAQMKAFANKGADPDVSALFGVRRDLPPAMVVTAEFDVLRDEAIQYAKKLQEVGVPCEWKHYKTAFHGLCTLPDTPVAKHIIEDVCCFLDGNL